MPSGLREEMKLFLAEAIETKAPRDDYLELLQLSFIFLGGSLDGGVTFQAPGATHNARWMAKAIYSLKIYFFQDQVILTPQEITGLTSICLFVSLVYACYWHEAPVARRAPFNELTLLAQLHEYPDRVIREAAVEHSVVTCGISPNTLWHLLYLMNMSVKTPRPLW